MTPAVPDLDPDEWLLRRLSPFQRLEQKQAGRYRPSSASFSAASGNGGISFNREKTLRSAREGLRYGCPDTTFGVAAIRVCDLIDIGLNVRPTPPPPHHADAFGLVAMSGSQDKRIRKMIAGRSLIAVWPGGIETWPPTDEAPRGWIQEP